MFWWGSGLLLVLLLLLRRPDTPGSGDSLQESDVPSQGKSGEGPRSLPAPPPPNTEAADRFLVVEPETPPDPRLNRLSEDRVEFLPAIEASQRISKAEGEAQSLREIDALLSHYRFAYGENPVGVENAEFTRQLMGENPKGIVFLSPQNPSVRGEELVDRWGTPYFFHPLSGQVMEIVSAGPDQTFWTDDDVGMRHRQER